MSFPRVRSITALVLGCLLLAAGLIFSRPDSGENTALPASREHGPSSDADIDVLVDPLSTEEGHGREVAESALDETDRDPMAASPRARPRPAKVRGAVVDLSGAAIAGALVEFDDETREGIHFARPAGGRAGRGRDTFGQPLPLKTRSNGDGHFTVDGIDRRRGGTLRFQPPGYIEGHVLVPIDPESDWQLLQALPTPHQDSRVTFWVTGTEKLKGVEVEAVKVDHLRGSFPYPRRLPLASEQTMEQTDQWTQVVQSGLAPGTWRFTFLLRYGLPQRVEIEIEAPGTQAEQTILVEAWPGADATDIEFEPAEAGELPWLDASSGIEDWLPEERLRLGEDQRDRYFAMTLRVGYGPVKAAELTLRLRAIHGMSRNDALYLEHRGSREFAWRTSIEALTGRWRQGMRRTLHLDLARLPLSGGEVLDLRSALEDGLLDVVVQDDTAIEAVSIRIIR